MSNHQRIRTTDRQLVNSLANSSTDRQLVNSLANSDDGQTIGQLTGEFVDGQTIGQVTGEFGRRTDNWSTHWRIRRRTDNWSTHWRIRRQSASNHDEQTTATDKRLVTVNTIIDASFQDHESRNTIISSTQPLFWHHDLLMEWSDVVACQW
jgi:hypothetical protein